MNFSGRCTVYTCLRLPKDEVILEGILFIQEIFLGIFTCQDYMFKFFDKANSGPHAYFLKRFASISSGFPAQKRLLLYHGSGGRHRLLISEAGSQPCIKGSSPQLTWRQQFLSSAKKRKLLQALRLRKMYATRPSASARRCKFSSAPPREGTPRPTGVSTSGQSPGRLLFCAQNTARLEDSHSRQHKLTFAQGSWTSFWKKKKKSPSRVMKHRNATLA